MKLRKKDKRQRDKRTKTTPPKCMQVQLEDWSHNACSIVAVVLLALFFTANALAQEATQTAPWAYKLQFENEWVRVIRVHYEPHEKLPPHAHTKWPCVYVYLNDSGPVIFRHKDWEHPELTRPATKAGSFRISPTAAVNEVHEVNNPNDTPSDFLRVEFKTEPIGRTALQGRYYREPSPAGENYCKVQFENEQLRVTRLICAPHKRLEVATSASAPALLVSLSVARLRTKSGANQTTLGQNMWLAGGQRERFENLGDAPMEWLRFDLKTTPVTALETNAERQRTKGRKTKTEGRKKT
ncbi:MAG TPA: cupin domain-containing protein [Blastocatellia bacterium]|nr:cupin domain-containing protein [Blastocatellia bacterium]